MKLKTKFNQKKDKKKATFKKTRAKFDLKIK